MAKTSSAIPRSCTKLEIAECTAGSCGAYTDISGHSMTVDNTTQARMGAETHVFDGDTPVITGGKRNGGVQHVRLAAHVEQLAPCRLDAGRLGKDAVAQGKYLVGTDDEGLRRKLADGFSLGAGQNFGNVLRLEFLLAAHGLMHGSFIEARRLDDESESGRFQQSRANLAARGEDQRRAIALQEPAHGSSTGAPRS